MAEGDRPQDVGRSHRRMRRLEATLLPADEREKLLEARPLDAYRASLRSATWLYGADQLAAVILRDVLEQLEPAPSAQLALDGKPAPAKAIALADRLRLWALALELAGELGLTADARRRIGLELTPPAEPAAGPGARARGPRRRVDFGGA